MKLKYKTWIKTSKLILFLILAILFFVTGIVINRYWIMKAIFWIFGLVFFYISIVLIRTIYAFSDKGESFQRSIHSLIMDRVGIQQKKILDIGAGNGALAIMIAKKSPLFHVTGIDTWKKEWGYSQKQAANNSVIEKVVEQVDFVESTAESLPFSDNCFDTVVSCLTFHEVRSSPDKSKLLQEAVRVLKDGGDIIFVDLFYDKKVFGEVNNLFETLPLDNIVIQPLNSLIPLPKVLNNKKSLKYAALVSAKKSIEKQLK